MNTDEKFEAGIKRRGGMFLVFSIIFVIL